MNLKLSASQLHQPHNLLTSASVTNAAQTKGNTAGQSAVTSSGGVNDWLKQMDKGSTQKPP